MSTALFCADSTAQYFLDGCNRKPFICVTFNCLVTRNYNCANVKHTLFYICHVQHDIHNYVFKLKLFCSDQQFLRNEIQKVLGQNVVQDSCYYSITYMTTCYCYIKLKGSLSSRVQIPALLWAWTGRWLTQKCSFPWCKVCMPSLCLILTQR